MKKIATCARIDMADLPELATSVALPAGRKRQEVGGMACLGIAAGIAVYMMS